jgi:hypothetical protein
VVEEEVEEDAVVVVAVVVEEEEEVGVEVEVEDREVDSRGLHRVQDRVVELLEVAGPSVNLLEEHLRPRLRGHHLSLPSLSLHHLHRLRLLFNFLNVSSMTLLYLSLILSCD